MIWILATVLATGFQVARNAAQRELVADAGPWGATLVRFLFGLPFSLLFVAVACLMAGRLHPRLSVAYLGFALSAHG